MDTSENIMLDEALALLDAHGYRVTRPFEPRTTYSDLQAPENLLKAAVLDTETTGMNQASDKIIELGIVVFQYCPQTGQVYRVLETFNELEDPGMSIPAESTKIHNITDAMVAGKRIDDAAVHALLSDVSLVIAHNADFDRGFVEARLPLFAQKAWACSLKQVPWKSEGYGGASLEFLAYRNGFHYSGHRASADCHALLEVLQCDLSVSGGKALKTLLANARGKEIKVWALNAPFESKDKLKGRNYRWAAERKTWHGSVLQASLEQEVAWLREHIYQGHSFKLELEKIDARHRFSSRRGITETVSYPAET
jgi:DNA polymerase III subunit epsilon